MNWKTNPSDFEDMPDCEDKNFIPMLASTVASNAKIGMVGTSVLVLRLMICMTKMRREIKKLKMQPVDNISKN